MQWPWTTRCPVAQHTRFRGSEAGFALSRAEEEEIESVRPLCAASIAPGGYELAAVTYYYTVS